MTRTLVVHTGGIGDFLLACPAIARLDGEIELLGRPERLALAVEAGIARAAHDLDRVDFHTMFATPSDRAREFFGRFVRVVVWMRDPDGTIQRAIRACGVQEVSVYPGLPDAHWTAHASEYYAKCLAIEVDPNFRLSFAPEPGFDAILHPGSGSPSKNWPLDRLRQLGEALAEEGLHITWCIGPAERERMPGARELAPVLSAPLSNLARSLAGARLYVGNDSGITHLAACAGCPTVAVFGPTDPKVWAPRGSHVRVVCEEDWPDVPAVLAACRASVASGE